MSENTEVNFEKRGKLTDHYPCLKCGACACHKSCFPWSLFISILFAFIFFVSPVFAQTIDYKIKVLDTPVVDLNNRGAVITDDALILKNGLSVSLVCPGSDVSGLDNTVPNKLNDKSSVVGYCFQPGIGDVGFLRRPLRNGHYDFIHVPGSGSTFLFGVNDNDVAVGQYFDGDYHGFLWDGVTITTIDFPVLNAQTALLGITDNLVVIGAYFVQDPTTNEVSQWTGFLWSNGNFFPLDRPGSAFAFPLDVNNEQLVLGLSSVGGFQGGPGFPSGNAFVNDDTTFSNLGLPATIDGLDASFTPHGINDKGQLAGFLRLRFCPDPNDTIHCQLFSRGFIATPKKN